MADFFTHQIFFEWLLCAKHYSSFMIMTMNKAAKNLCVHGAYVLVGKITKENVEYVKWGHVLGAKRKAEKRVLVKMKLQS